MTLALKTKARLSCLPFTLLLAVLATRPLWSSEPASVPAWLISSLSTVPLLPVFPGVARGNKRAHIWLCLILLFYLVSALLRAMGDAAAQHASVVLALIGVQFVFSILWIRRENDPDTSATAVQ
ncbi:MAG: DUF2069 domain-containing protein [Pseudomonadota bacterium]|nr:DUF2069 domain-containing protein [Pseudomonadota bacterium]